MNNSTKTIRFLPEMEAATGKLEMQVVLPGDWTSRSLEYLCRDFDSLSRSKEYADVFSVVYIGILDFTLFKDAPEFYSKNMFMNVRTHKIYSDKLILYVLDLNMAEVSNAIFRMNADDIIRKCCRDREDYYRDIKRWKMQFREQGVALKDQQEKILNFLKIFDAFSLNL